MWDVQGDCSRDWRRRLERPPADSSEVVRWNILLVGCGWSESQLRWHVSDSGEVGRQVHCITRRSWLDFRLPSFSYLMPSLFPKWNTETNDVTAHRPAQLSPSNISRSTLLLHVFLARPLNVCSCGFLGCCLWFIAISPIHCMFSSFSSARFLQREVSSKYRSNTNWPWKINAVSE